MLNDPVPLTNGRLWSSGFELNSAVDGVEWTTHNGTTPASIQSDVVRTGFYAMQANPSTSTGLRNLAKQWLPANADANVYIRFYLRIAALPKDDTKILSLTTTAQSPTERASIRLAGNGALKLFNATTQVGSDSGVLALNTWYRIELHYNSLNPAGTDILEARIDGVNFAASSAESLGTTGKFYLGVINGTGNSTTNLYFDDVALNDGTATETQNTWCGDGKIIHLKPNGDDATNHGWRVSTGVTHFSLIDDVPPNDSADYLSANAPAIDDYDLENATGVIPAGSNITLVQAGFRASTSGGTNAIEAVRLKTSTGLIENNLSHDVIDAYKTNDAIINNGVGNYGLTASRQPGTGSNWTIAALDSAQIGYRYVSGDRTSTLTAAWLLVEYVPVFGNASGVVTLPNRTDHGGITITTSNGASTTTASNGNFSLALMPGTYTITAAKNRHLAVSRANVPIVGNQTTTLPNIALIPGDATGDNVIDVADLSLVGANFGLNNGFSPLADINGDSKVDILDLVLVGANYGMFGPQPW